MISEESRPAFFRPEARRLASLTNEELQLLFEHRAAKVKLDPKGFWDNPRIVYWDTMMPLLLDLHEVMLEIQSRYPNDEICPGGEVRYFEKLLPLKEWPWTQVAAKNLKPCQSGAK